MNILKQLRRCFAAFFTISITLLFLDFTGSIHFLLGWTAKIQFIPALFALNFIVVAILLILTFVFGRLYCSVICPLGVFQDVVSGIAWIKKKNRFYYSHSFNILRWGFLALFILSFFVGFGVIVDILDPYSSFGVMAPFCAAN